MKSPKLALMIGVAAISIALAAPTYAQALQDNSITVKAQRLPQGTPVQISGMIASKAEDMLLVEQANGTVFAKLPVPVSDDFFKAGHDITVFGRLERMGKDVTIDTQAVYVRNAAGGAELIMMPDPMQNARGTGDPTRHQTLTALADFRSQYRALG